MSDGRRAAVWWTVLLAVIIAGDHLLALALHQVLMRSQFRYSRLYRGGNDADVVIIGDSRGVHSFYAPALQQMTGLRVMNLSYNSLSPHVAEAVLLDYLDHNRAPRIVVIEATSAITSGAVASQLRTYAGFSPRIVNEPDFMATVLTLVESGLCVSIVPRCVASLKRPVVIRSIIPRSARIPLCVVWRKSSDNPAVTAFLEILRASRPAIRRQMEKMIRQSNEAA